MEEDQYRKTYHSINQLRCVFEKAIVSRKCTCKLSQRFNLADREGIACTSPAEHVRCDQLLQLLRTNASFALQMKNIDGPLPHAREIKVQVGGLTGLSRVIFPSKADDVITPDIASLLQHAKNIYGQIELLPYAEIMKSVASFKGRQHRKKGQ